MTNYYKLIDIRPRSSLKFYTDPTKIIFVVLSFVILALYEWIGVSMFLSISGEVYSFPNDFLINITYGVIFCYFEDILPMISHSSRICAISILPFISLFKASYTFIQCTMFNESCDLKMPSEKLFVYLPLICILCLYHLYIGYQLIKCTIISDHLKDKRKTKIVYESKITRFYRVDDVQPEPPVSFFNNPVEDVFLTFTLLITFVAPYVFKLYAFDLPCCLIFAMGFFHIIAFCAYATNNIPIMMAHFSFVGLLVIVPDYLTSLYFHRYIKRKGLGFSPIKLEYPQELQYSFTGPATLDCWKVSLIQIVLYFDYIYTCYSMIKYAIITNHLKDKQVISIE